jgi:uncharacterized protein
MKNEKTQILYEILGLMVILTGGAMLFPAYKGVLIFIPLVYLFVERRFRKRTLAEIGFKLRETGNGLLQNWWLILLVGVVTQLASVWIGQTFVPGFLEHVQARIPFLDQMGLVAFILPMALGTFGEEIIYRGIFQERLSWFWGTAVAIVITSVTFGLAHYSPGPLNILLVDMGLIVVDSILYGLIFARSKNLFVSWIAHFLADIVGLVILIMM